MLDPTAAPQCARICNFSLLKKKNSAGSGRVMTSRPCANTQKYLEGCNFFCNCGAKKQPAEI